MLVSHSKRQRGMSTLSESIKPSFVDPMKTCYSIQNSYKVKVVYQIKDKSTLKTLCKFIYYENKLRTITGMVVLLDKNPFLKSIFCFNMPIKNIRFYKKC